MFRSVLVPLDGSVFGEHALPVALSIARRAGIALHVVHVHVPPLPIYADTITNMNYSADPAMREQERAYLANVVQRLQIASRVEVTYRLLDSQVAEAIQEYAQAHDVDLVVMTTHGRGLFSRFWLGSVADQLVRSQSVPVLLIRPQEEKADFTREYNFAHILVSLDGSELAEQVLAPAIALGRLMQSEVTLVRVVEPVMLVGYDPVGAALDAIDQERLERQKAEAQTYLLRVAGRFREQVPSVKTRVVISHHPAKGILDEARAQVCSLIALSTHGRRGVGRLFLGSVADKVLRAAPTPVLIYHPTK
jgi:nucleotide-binding universal stress UspA family protein